MAYDGYAPQIIPRGPVRQLMFTQNYYPHLPLSR